MAYVQTSNEPKNQDLGGKPTGALRYWQPLEGGRELQQEFRNEHGFGYWLTIPTETEIKEADASQ